MSHFPVGLQNNALWKIAARAGLRRIAQMVSQGNVAGANRLATTPGVLKKTMAGSQIKQLGAGFEGVSTLTAHPKRGLEVRKVFDPMGIAGPGSIQNRERLGTALQHNQDLAQFRGAHDTPGGLRAHRYEYVPGQSLDAMTTAQRPVTGEAVTNIRGSQPASGMTMDQRISAQQKRMALQARQSGIDLKDLHSGNVVTGPQGTKTVDALAMPRGTNIHDPKSGLNQENVKWLDDAREQARQGVETSYLGYATHPSRPGNILGQAYGGTKPMNIPMLDPRQQTAIPVTSGTTAAPTRVVRGTGVEAAVPQVPVDQGTRVARPRPRPPAPAAVPGLPQ